MNATLLLALLVAADPHKAAPPVKAVAYSADGKQLAAAGYGEVLLLDPTGNEVVGRRPAAGSAVTAVAFAADGRLAVAAGAPGKPPEIRIGDRTLIGPKDAIYGLAFRPDGKQLAAAGYDRVVYVWDNDRAKPQEWRDHSDAIYGLAFSPDGTLLATVAADRTVKVWDTATGKRLYTLGEATDWLYAVAWHPNGKHLAAAGVDKTIRVWRVSATDGKLINAQFAHEAPITKLAYAPNGVTLYTSAEDRTLKVWDATKLTEMKVHTKQPDTVLAIAMRPDGKQIALGRYDGTLALLDPATGMMTDVLPAKPKPPQIAKVSPDFGPRGRTTTVVITGKYLDGVTRVTAEGIGVRIQPNGVHPERLTFDLAVPATLPAGRITLTLQAAAGSTTVPFTVDLFPAEPDPTRNDAPSAAKVRPIDRTFIGTIDRAGAVDYYRFKCAEYQAVGVQCATASIGSKLEPALEWLDAAGNVLAESANGLLAAKCGSAGVYTLAVRDRDFRGGKDMHYRLYVGTVPIVASVYPLGLRAGAKQTIHLNGVFLDSAGVEVSAADAKPGTKLPVPVRSKHGPVLGSPTVVVGEFPECDKCEDVIAVPGTGNGLIRKPGAVGEWSFVAKKGERLVIEVNARRLGSPLDSWIEVTDGNGKPVERAVLRGVAKVYVTLRDHDSNVPGIRLESFNEFAMDDYVLIDRELMRIETMPRGPDDDCRFYSFGGSRLGFLGTTPAAHANNSPAYKVQVHPPGSSFPPNGLPLVRLNYRNDDGGPGFGKDSRLEFDPPNDGLYRIHIGDSRGHGGPDHAYRLTVRPPKPDYSLALGSRTPAVWRGGALPLSVTVTRLDGFDGPVAVRLDGLPPGFHSASTTVEAGQFTTTLAVWADADAKSPPVSTSFKLVGEATIGGQQVVRETQAGRPTAIDPGTIVTTVAQKELTIQPGHETTFDVTIERREGFKGRIPLDVRGLPRGVRVENVGLNGILVTERETKRRVVLYAEPWVKPTTLPIVVLATHEGKGTQHAALPVTLRVGE
ncbi:MAG: hypothetical protein U0746_03880 [Gemmataceae bacterium]